MNPIVTIDSREQRPLAITGFPAERRALPCGDYGIAGFSDWTNPQFVVERKSLPDLVGSLTTGRERFWRECMKLRQFKHAILLIEAWPEDVLEHRYRSAASPAAIMGSLRALSLRCGIHIVWGGDHAGAAAELEGLVKVFVSGIQKDAKRLTKMTAHVAPTRGERGLTLYQVW